MRPIVESNTVRAELTRYEVPGWGTGELWTGARLVLAHDFDFRLVSDTGDAVPGRSSERVEGQDDMRTHPKPRKTTGVRCGLIDTHPSRPSLDTKRCLTPEELVQCVTAYFSGHDVAFVDVPLDLGALTSFQRAVADALRRIPRGDVVAYGELAALAGYPGAQRAVGTFCARNRFMLFIPCHRVVGAHGIGSYGSSGLEVKRRLLALEGVAL